MDKELQQFEQEYLELEKKLAEPTFISQQQEYVAASKRFAELAPVVAELLKLRNIETQLASIQKVLQQEQDSELLQMAQQELESLEQKRQALADSLQALNKELTSNNHPQQGSNKILIEIRAGTGGDEAALFAADLFRMYKKQIENKGWGLEVVNENRDELGGYKEIAAEASGKDIFNFFKLEIGVHRVQRIPETEKTGRIHTSTATVAVLPVVKNVEVELNEKDLETDFFRSSGAGGQNVNKLETAVRIKHIPSGLVVACQSERYQHQNKERAMEMLRSKLYQLKQEEEQAKLGSERKKQVGTAERSEKIRTYNFPQDRITDHRLNQSWKNIPRILNGNLEIVWEAFREQNQA